MSSKILALAGRLVTANDDPEKVKEHVIRSLAARKSPSDRTFDSLLPEELRELSGVHWSPLLTVVRAASWLDEFGIRKVVDIGSGIGKFCVASALASPHRICIGIEERPSFIKAASELAERFGVSQRVHFHQGAFGEIPTPFADAYYLYNPFEENISESDRIPVQMDLNEARYSRDIAAVEHLLWGAPEGTVLVTYNGFGGRVPQSYKELRVDRGLPCELRLWRKERPSRDAMRRWMSSNNG